MLILYIENSASGLIVSWSGRKLRGSGQVKRFGFCCKDQPSVREMVDDADDSIFSQLISSNHVLHQLIPPRRNSCYDLRPRHHDRLITQKPNTTVDSDFIIRMLFKDSD